MFILDSHSGASLCVRRANEFAPTKERKTTTS